MKKILMAIILLVYIVSFTFPSTAVSLNSAKQQKSSVDSRINKIQSDKKKAQEEKAKLESTKKDIISTQTAEKSEYDQLVSEVDKLKESITEIDQSIADADADFNEQNELFKKRLKVMYENSNVSTLDMLLQSTNLVDFIERVQYISLIAKNDKKLLKDLEEAKLDVEYKKKLQEDAKQELLDKVNDKQDRLTSLKASRAELENQIQRSKEQLAKLEKQEDALIAESNRLQSEIKNLQRSGKYTGGTMVWPCPGNYSIASSFGMRKHPILRKYKMHTGIDISANKGVSIIAAASGTVIISKYDKNGYGNYLVVDHGGGITTLYGHCSKLLVDVGDKVKAGQVIAKVGSTGLATGPHLHFEVRKNGVPTNPLNGYVKK